MSERQKAIRREDIDLITGAFMLGVDQSGVYEVSLVEPEVWVETEGVWLNRVFYLQPGRYVITRKEDSDE